jgi:hypothetical protein
MNEDTKSAIAGSKFRWGKFIGLFILFISATSFLAPKRANVFLLDIDSGRVLDQSEAIYFQPFWGTDIATYENGPGVRMQNGYFFNSFSKSIVLKGRIPDISKPGGNYGIVSGRTYITGTTTIPGRSTIFAWDLWLLFNLLPSLILSFIFTKGNLAPSLQGFSRKHPDN